MNPERSTLAMTPPLIPHQTLNPNVALDVQEKAI